VGKSTLANALVGEKIAITSAKPETTRRQIRGIVHRENCQVVLVDTPGLHRPRTPLGERLDQMVHEALADVDVAMVCLPADQSFGPGDRFLLEALPAGLKRIAVVTKIDKINRSALAGKLVGVDELADWEAVVPVSARDGSGVAELTKVLTGTMPPGPPWYQPEVTTDEPVTQRVAELIREAALDGTRQELPHSLAVVVEEAEPPDIYASLYVERDSQKGIVIGAGGKRLKQTVAVAKAQIEQLLGTKVKLTIHVKVAKDWQRDPKALDRLGF
jgi:GTP-binding protein Era